MNRFQREYDRLLNAADEPRRTRPGTEHLHIAGTLTRQSSRESGEKA